MSTHDSHGKPDPILDGLSPEYKEYLKTVKEKTGWEASDDTYTEDFKLIHETERAVLLQPANRGTEPEAWVPRSQILSIEDTGDASCGFCIYTVTIKRWLAKKNWSIDE